MDPLSCKISTFFHRSLALSLQIYRNFQSNEANLQYFKLEYGIMLFFISLKLSHVSSIWLEISINWHTKSQGPKKKCITCFTSRMIHSCPATPTVFMVVLLHKQWDRIILYFLKCMYIPTSVTVCSSHALLREMITWFWKLKGFPASLIFSVKYVRSNSACLIFTVHLNRCTLHS